MSDESRFPYSEKMLVKIAKGITKGRDRYAKMEVLRKAVPYEEQMALLVCLVRSGHLNIAVEVDLWERYGEAYEQLGGEDVVSFLKALDYSVVHGLFAVFPRWPRVVDDLVMRVFAEDEEPILEAFDELPEPARRGVALVRARFGEKEVFDSLDGVTEEYAGFYYKDYVADQILWSEEEGLKARELFDAQEPNENFDALLSLFSSAETFGEAVKKKILEDESTYRPDIFLVKFKHAVQAADADEMARLLERVTLYPAMAEQTGRALLEWRDDEAETLTKIALSIEGDGLRKWPAAAAAILKMQDENREVPQEVLDVLILDGGTPSVSWINSRITRYPQEQRHYPAIIDQAFSLAQPGAFFPERDLLFRALSGLPEEAVRGRIEERFSKDYTKESAVPFLYLVDDEELWEQGIETCLDAKNARDSSWYGLGHLPLKALPLLVDGRERAKRAEKKRFFQRAILALMARAIDGGALWEEKWDDLVGFDVVEEDYDYHKVQPLLLKIIHRLPEGRAEAVLLRELAEEKSFARAFQMIASHPTPSVVQAGIEGLLAYESSLSHNGQREVAVGLKALEQVRSVVKQLLSQGGGGHIAMVLQEALGGADALEAIKLELAGQGVDAQEELDEVDKLAIFAEQAGGGSQTLYILRRLDEEPEEPGLNVIGDSAPGVGSDRWPSFEETPMTHLFTLDLQSMPVLQERYPKARTVSLFCFQPFYNEAWEPNSGQTAVISSTQAEIDAAEAYVPEEVEALPRQWFEPVAITVDPGLFDDERSGDELRSTLYRASARVLGEPIWLQDEQYQGEFLLQFDEGFVDVNLGDMGVMYVFSDTAFWQSH